MDEKRHTAHLVPPEGVDWGKIYQQLWSHGRHHLRLSGEDAKDLAQEALRRFHDPQYAKGDHPTLLSCLGSIMNGLAQNMRTRRGYMAELPTEDGAVPSRKDSSASPEERALNADQLRKLVDSVYGNPEASAGAMELVDQFLCFVDEPAEQAIALGVPIDKVYKLRAELRDLVRAAEASLEAGERGAKSK